MSLVDKGDDLDNLQLQTRDPFQLELIDAVKRRKKRESGFEDGVDKSTQRHSKELDFKMSKYLSNKQSPYHKDNSLGESSSFQGDTPETMYLGSAGVVNNARTTSSLLNSKWKPSIVIDGDDGIVEDSSTDDEDDIVIGSNTWMPRENTKVTNAQPYSNEGLRDLRERSDVTETGLRQKASVSSKIELGSYKKLEAKEESDKTEPQGKVSSERLGIQKRKQFDKEEEKFETRYSASGKNLKGNRKGSREENLNKAESMERPTFGRRGKIESHGDPDYEVNVRNVKSLDEVKSSSERHVDNIFEYGGTRKPDSLQNVEGNLRRVSSAKIREDAHENPIESGRKSGSRSPKSRSGSGRVSPVDVKKSSRKQSFTGDGEIRGKTKYESDKPKSRSSSGKNTPDVDKGRSLSGRSSPGEALLSSVSRKLSQSESKQSTSKDNKLRSRTGSGRDLQDDSTLSQSKERGPSQERRERPKSAKVREANHEIDNRHHEIQSDRRPPSRGSKKELKQVEDIISRDGKEILKNSDVPNRASSSHRRSYSIGNSPREMEDSKRVSSPRDSYISRERSKSDAMSLVERQTSNRGVNNKHGKDRNQNEENKLGNKYSIKRPSSTRSMRGKDGSSSSDEDDDDEPIGIRRSSHTSRKENGHKGSDSKSNDDRRTTPVIKGPFSSEIQTTEKLKSREFDDSGGEHEVENRFNRPTIKTDISSTAGKDSLSKFKIKGRTEKSHSKTTPLKPSKDIKVPQSSSGKSDKGPKGASNGKLSKTTTKRSMSFTNISNIKPKSPYRESETTTTNTESRRNSIVDSETLREQIYYDWLQQKSNKTKEEIKELRRRDKEKENEAEKEKEDKKIMSKKAFDAWSADKDEKLKEKLSGVKEKKLKEREKQDEEQQRKLDSKKHFESWRSSKEKELIEQRRKKREEEREKRRKEFDDQEEKRSSSKKVFENWKSKKEEQLKEKSKEKKELERQKKLENIEKMERKRKAEKLFETWKETKQKSPGEKTTLTQRAWCPSGRKSQNAIPQDVKPVIQRNPPNRVRTLSATARLQNRTMNSTFNRT